MTGAGAAATLRDQATAVLSGNDRGSFIAPGPHQYPGQWNWDAALVTIGLAHVDPARGRHEVEQLLEGQWSDGLVPHVVFWEEAGEYFPGPGVWDSASMAGAPRVPVTGITQPPVLATAIRLLHERDPDRGFLERVVPAVDRWHEWLYRQRRTESGLVVILHPWESGTDDSPRFDQALDAVRIDHTTEMTRRDTRHVPAEQRPTDTQYQRYLTLVESLRRSGYRPPITSAAFAYGDVGFTSILARAEEDLASLWGHLGEPGDRCLRRRDSLGRGLDDAWDEGSRSFLDRDLVSDGEVSDSGHCVASLLPLFSGMAGHRAESLRNRLEDEEWFGSSGEHRWGVTSVTRSHSAFDAMRYWRGPVWVNMNWFLVRGLRTSGMHEQADWLRAHTLDLVSRHGMFEYYDPRTGRGLGSPDFSWTAALTIDLLDRP